MTTHYSPIHSSCVVALCASSVEERTRFLNDAGAIEVSQEDNGRGSSILFAWFDDAGVCGQAVAKCREQGDRAVAGPMSRGAWLAWQRHVSPVSYDERSCICFPWSTVDAEHFDEIVEIDPGRGFGAGRHPSTQLVLEEMMKHRLDGMRVLDVGCGTGVLSVVAAKRGAHVTAIDIDGRAVSATCDNASLNGVDHMIEASLSSISDIEPDFDLVFANIHVQAMIQMAPHLHALLAQPGALITSGISKAQVSGLEASLAPLESVSVRQRGEWVVMVLSKT
ncbi:MAG: 50S ribosomal protein L11 methyltransferase [Acidimicrobiales bacterium]